MTWKKYFKQYKFQIFLISILFIATLIAIYFFLQFIENRTGTVLNDPFLNLIPPLNVSIPLFLLTYVGTLLGIGYVLGKPDLTIITALTYMLILWLRIICMYFTPLEPPDKIIPLRDFVLESTFYSGNVNIKDLFFSGHTASMFLFFMVIPNKFIKGIYLLITFLVASLVLIQHAHYTIDVLVAPIMVWFAYRMAEKIKSFLFCKITF
ncbi:MAG: phosphatase PAP2-related protein [Bacteroidales bacterium]